MNSEVLLHSIMAAFYLLFGLSIGSFLNVCIYRIPLKESIVVGHSHCMNCQHRLSVKDLIPIISWLQLKGKCRYCNAKIGVRYPLVEGGTGSLFLLVYWIQGHTVWNGLTLLFFSILIVLAFIDMDTQLVPETLNGMILLVGIAWMLLEKPILFSTHLIGLFAVSLPLFLVVLVTNGMGMGDVKLFAAVGFLLGWKLVLLSFLISSVLAAVVGLILQSKGKLENQRLPFVPFMAIAFVIATLFGNQLINWYWSWLTGQMLF